jgi:hypothetical protein
MELIILVAGAIIFDLLAMRYGVDSRVRSDRGWWACF